MEKQVLINIWMGIKAIPIQLQLPVLVWYSISVFIVEKWLKTYKNPNVILNWGHFFFITGPFLRCHFVIKSKETTYSKQSKLRSWIIFNSNEFWQSWNEQNLEQEDALITIFPVLSFFAENLTELIMESSNHDQGRH